MNITMLTQRGWLEWHTLCLREVVSKLLQKHWQ